MAGHYVKLIRQTGANVYQSNWMNFCEVQVYGYLYYGKLPYCAWWTVSTTPVDGDPVSYPLRLFQYGLLSEPGSRQSFAISMKQQREYGLMRIRNKIDPVNIVFSSGLVFRYNERV